MLNFINKSLTFSCPRISKCFFSIGTIVKNAQSRLDCGSFDFKSSLSSSQAMYFFSSFWMQFKCLKLFFLLIDFLLFSLMKYWMCFLYFDFNPPIEISSISVSSQFSLLTLLSFSLLIQISISQTLRENDFASLSEQVSGSNLKTSYRDFNRSSSSSVHPFLASSF